MTMGLQVNLTISVQTLLPLDFLIVLAIKKIPATSALFQVLC